MNNWSFSSNARVWCLMHFRNTCKMFIYCLVNICTLFSAFIRCSLTGESSKRHGSSRRSRSQRWQPSAISYSLHRSRRTLQSGTPTHTQLSARRRLTLQQEDSPAFFRWRWPLVLRKVFELNTIKLGAKWEGPYEISKIVKSGVYVLMTHQGTIFILGMRTTCNLGFTVSSNSWTI